MEHHKPIYPLPKEAELVDYTHGAAGHEGLTSDVDGTIIVKPCTQAEIDFYEAARAHPEFQAHMPVFMGVIERGNKTGVDLPPSALQEGVGAPVVAEPASTEGPSDLPATEPKPVSAQAAKRVSKVWVPSGGKKLHTDLCIILENAAVSFKKPNVMDLKLGSRLWADDAPSSKREKLDQVAAETTSGSLGFRVAGAKLWLGDEAAKADVELHTEVKDGYKSFNKHYGRGLDEQSVQKAIARFISGTANPVIFGRDKSLLQSPQARTLTKRLIREMESIEYVLKHEESRMYSASVLIVIEGDHKALVEAMAAEEQMLVEKDKAAAEAADAAEEAAEEAKANAEEQGKTKDDNHVGNNDNAAEDDDNDDDDDDDDDEDSIPELPKIMEVRLIDFAHAAFTPGQGPDENALQGVRSIIEILKEIIN